jgi:hypothetical protein
MWQFLKQENPKVDIAILGQSISLLEARWPTRLEIATSAELVDLLIGLRAGDKSFRPNYTQLTALVDS